MIYSDSISRPILISFLVILLLSAGLYYIYGDQLKDFLRSQNLMSQVLAPNELKIDELKERLLNTYEADIDTNTLSAVFYPKSSVLSNFSLEEVAYINLEATQAYFLENGVTVSPEEIRQVIQEYFDNGTVTDLVAGLKTLLISAEIPFTDEVISQLTFPIQELFQLENYWISLLPLKGILSAKGVDISHTALFAFLEDLYVDLPEVPTTQTRDDGAIINRLNNIFSNHQLSTNNYQTIQRARTTQAVLDTFIEAEAQ